MSKEDWVGDYELRTNLWIQKSRTSTEYIIQRIHETPENY